MAYYDEMNDDGYYNPYEYGSQQPDLKSALGSTVKMIATVGILNVAGRAISGKMSSIAGSAIKRYSKAPLHSIAKNMTNPTLGGIFKQTSAGQSLRNFWKSTSLSKAAAQRRSYLQRVKASSPDSYGIERIKSVFKNPATTIASVGGLWARNAVAGVGVSYAVDSMLGLTREMGLEKKPIYDIPGHVGNFMKWFGQESLYSTAFGAAGPMVGAIGSIAKTSLGKAFGGDFGKMIVKKFQKIADAGVPTDLGSEFENKFFKSSVLSDARSTQEKTFAAKSASKSLAWGRTVMSSLSQANKAFHQMGDAYLENFNNTRSLKKAAGASFQPVFQALKNARAISEKKPGAVQFSSTKHTGITALQFLDKLLTQSQTIGHLQEKHDLQPFIKAFTAQSEHLEKKTIIDYAFKFLKPLRNKDVVDKDFSKDMIRQLSPRFGNKQSSQLVNTVMNMRVGSRIYKAPGSNIKGGGVDLSVFDPLLMARKAASKLMSFQINIPMMNGPISMGEITRLQRFISESPSFAFFDKGPQFKLDGSAGKEYANMSSIADLSTEKTALFTYMNGTWGVFDGAGVKVVNTNRVLRYAAGGSLDKTGEITSINIDRVKKLNDVSAMNTLIEKAERGHQFKNKYLNFLQKTTGLGIPEQAERLLNSLTDKIKGKNHSYKQAVSEFFNLDIAGGVDQFQGSLGHLETMLGQSSQVLSRVLSNKKGLAILADSSHDRMLAKNVLGELYDNSKVLGLARGQMSTPGLNADAWRFNKSAQDAFKIAEAFPDTAKEHISVKRLGHFSSMNAYDEVRVGVADNVFFKDFMESSSGNGEAHPLLKAIPKLLDERIITKKEASALSLHAKLAAFRDKGLFSKTGSPNRDDLFRGLMKEIRTDKHWKTQQIQEELINFVSNNDFRSPRIRRSQNEILEGSVPSWVTDSSPYFSTPRGLLGVGDYATSVLDSVTSMFQEVYPFRKNKIKHHGFLGNVKYLATGMATVAAATELYRGADLLFAANPLFDQTALDDGITGIVSDTVARGRLFSQKVSDLTGMTGTLKYLEGLMPGSTSTIPGLIAGGLTSKVMGNSPFKTLKWMATGALINRAADPYLPDYSTDYETLKKQYSGEETVPFMKSPTWLLGSTPWEGTKVQGYQPNWYVRAKSRWQSTSTMYGGEIRRFLHEPLPFLGFNVGDLVDPYYMERLHFFKRPYPTSGPLFDEVPIVGPLLSGTIGRIIKPQKTMHQEFLTGEDNGEEGGTNFAVRPFSEREGRAMMMHTPGVRRTAGRSGFEGTFAYSGHGMYGQLIAQDFMSRTASLAGLQGFMGETLVSKIAPEPLVMPTLETAGKIASMSRSYYDMNLGGVGFLTEGIRRLMVKPDYKKYGVNPIPNLMPNWLPSEYLTGDPYSKIMKGELRLPGKAYLSTHRDIQRTMPGRSSMLGGPLEHQIQYFTGLLPPVLKEEYDILETGTSTHRQIQDMLAAEGLLIQAEALVYDAKNDISGHVDAIVREGVGGKGRRALEIKTISDEALEKLEAPKDEHVGQLNFYLKQLHLKKGTVLYVSRDNPANVKTFTVNYSQSRWERDLNKLQRSRQIAADMMEKGIGDDLGFSYSWLDRLEILADVAPNSREYQEAKMLVQKQIAEGLLGEKDIHKFRKIQGIRQARIRKYELYPLRFKGKVLTPDTEYNLESINENIKSGASYSLPERVVGAIWEQFTNTNTWVIDKFWAFKDPLEHYKMTRLYGKEYKPWDEPIQSFVEPAARSLLSKDDPLAGALSWGMGGHTIAGPIGGMIGSVIGSVYGTGMGLWRGLTDSAYIPGSVDEKRQIESYFDRAKFIRNDRLSQLTTGLTSQAFMQERDATLTAMLRSEKGGTVSQLFRATPFGEKPYIESWLNTNNERERKEILKMVPEDLGSALQIQWRKNDQEFNTRDYLNNTSAFLAGSKTTPKYDRSILDPSVNLEDIKLKTVEEAGLDAHEFGLGWNDQMLRMQENFNKIQGVNRATYSGNETFEPANLSTSQVKQTIIDYFNRHGLKVSASVFINAGGDQNYINVTIRRNKAMAILNALENRRYING